MEIKVLTLLLLFVLSATAAPSEERPKRTINLFFQHFANAFGINTKGAPLPALPTKGNIFDFNFKQNPIPLVPLATTGPSRLTLPLTTVSPPTPAPTTILPPLPSTTTAVLPSPAAITTVPPPVPTTEIPSTVIPTTIIPSVETTTILPPLLPTTELLLDTTTILPIDNKSDLNIVSTEEPNSQENAIIYAQPRFNQQSQFPEFNPISQQFGFNSNNNYVEPPTYRHANTLPYYNGFVNIQAARQHNQYLPPSIPIQQNVQPAQYSNSASHSRVKMHDQPFDFYTNHNDQFSSPQNSYQMNYFG